MEKMNTLKNIIIFCFFMAVIASFTSTSNRVYAATLGIVSDTITTSRPSPSSPLNGNSASGATQVTIFNNGSMFLASDSTRFIRTSTNAFIGNAVTVASQSGALTTVYFSNTTSTTDQGGTDVLISPMTAMHTVAFTTIAAIPSAGKIIITFPTLSSGDANNAASPSATTFQTNGLAQANFKVYDVTASSDITANFTANSGSITVTAPTAGTAPVITLLQGTTTSISSAHAIRIFIGCTALTGSGSSVSCSTQVPTLINPTKTAGAGTADSWTLTIQTQDNNSVNLDNAKIKIATIESVQVQANVDPTLTFTIAGVADGGASNANNTVGCTNTENTNVGITPTATFVNMGTLNTNINIAAQLLTVSTNAPNGYSLTATSSGHLIDPATGFGIQDNGTTPAAITAATPVFGIHACGLNVNTTTWGSGATGGGAGAKYGWPTPTSSATLASATSGPIGNTASTGGVGAGLTTVEYAATVNVSVPAGVYTSVVTYVATPTF